MKTINTIFDDEGEACDNNYIDYDYLCWDYIILNHISLRLLNQPCISSICQIENKIPLPIFFPDGLMLIQLVSTVFYVCRNQNGKQTVQFMLHVILHNISMSFY